LKRSGIKKLNIWAVLLILSAVIGPFVFFSSGMKPRVATTWYTNLGQILLFPFQWTWFTVTSGISEAVERYVYLVGTKQENEDLKRQLAATQVRVADYEEKELELTRLKELLRFARVTERRILVGQVINAPSRDPFQILRVDRGRNAEVRVGMPVVTAEGVLGQIIRVGPLHSDVQLLVDGNFKIDVLIQRTRVRGVLRGSAGDECLLHLHRRNEVRIGDRIVSSGLVGAIPKGLPVGYVKRISFQSDNVTQVVTVEPWVDYQKTEEVMLLDEFSKELDTIATTAGHDWIQFQEPPAPGG
jgi:rod shape-determining protein MreC